MRPPTRNERGSGIQFVKVSAANTFQPPKFPSNPSLKNSASTDELYKSSPIFPELFGKLSTISIISKKSIFAPQIEAMNDKALHSS
jgi:hypothetical protein